ncbi:MAG: arylamine N-acetyltransferase [Anaerolineae bacterium]|nr:arylamine N-acetyltransferase [Anaerolineae bacterium]
MNFEAYFRRIDYDGPGDPTLETLGALHRAHLLAVPFENLDIHLGRRIVLDEDWLFDKIVHQRRGGFCYEQNGLFAAVLRALGYEVTLLEARVNAREWASGTPLDHLTLVVSLEERWLVDVGFGDSFLEPLRFDDPGPQVQSNGVFRIIHDGIEGRHARRTNGGDWHDEYLLRLTPRTLADFAAGCDFHQTSPQSHFTRQRICSRATPAGRVTLSDHRLIVTEAGRRSEYDLEDESEFQRHLREQFGIELQNDL